MDGFPQNLIDMGLSRGQSTIILFAIVSGVSILQGWGQNLPYSIDSTMLTAGVGLRANNIII